MELNFRRNLFRIAECRQMIREFRYGWHRNVEPQALLPYCLHFTCYTYKLQLVGHVHRVDVQRERL